MATLRHGCKIIGQLLRNNSHQSRYLPSDYFRREETKPAERKSPQELFFFILITFYNKGRM